MTEDIENFSFNTAISAMMIFFNELGKYKEVNKDMFGSFMKILHPFAPHLTDELWQQAGNTTFLLNEKWPTVNAEMLKEEQLEMGVQINGKIKDRVKIPASATKEMQQAAALNSPKIKTLLEGQEIIKIIVVPLKMVSIVAKPKK